MVEKAFSSCSAVQDMKLCVELILQLFVAGTGIVTGMGLYWAEQTCKNYAAVVVVAAVETVPDSSQRETLAVEKLHEVCCITQHLAVVLAMWLIFLLGNVVVDKGWLGIDKAC